MPPCAAPNFMSPLGLRANDFSGFGSDHHIFVSDTLLAFRQHARAVGQTRPPSRSPATSPTLRGNTSHRDTPDGSIPRDATALFKSPVNSGVIEGVIDLVAEFGIPPGEHLCGGRRLRHPQTSARHQRPGPQPATAITTLNRRNFSVYPITAVADRKLNGTYDILDPGRAFTVTETALDTQNRAVLRWPDRSRPDLSNPGPHLAR